MRPFQSWIVAAALVAPTLPTAGAAVPFAGAEGPAIDAEPAASPGTRSEEAAGGAPTEHWYVLELDGQPAGWAVERWWRAGDRRITEAETSVRLSRGRQEIRVHQAGRFVETSGGEPVSLWTRSTLGSTPVEATYRYGEQGVRTVTLQEGREIRDILPLPDGEWLTPAAARRAVRRHHRAGATSYRVRAVDPLEGLRPVTVTRARLGPSELPEADGLWREETSSAPGVVSRVDLDADGQVLSSSTEILGLAATLRRTDRESATAALEAGPGPEVLLGTLVRPDRPLPHPDRLERAVYELSLLPAEVPGEAMGEGPEATHGSASLPEMPTAGGQRSERTAGGVRVTVALGTAGPGDDTGGTGPSDGGRPAEALTPEARSRLLASSPWLDHQDPGIHRLLERALDPEGGRRRTPDEDGAPGRGPARERPPDADPLPAPAPEEGAGRPQDRREPPPDADPLPAGPVEPRPADPARTRERARALERFVHGYLGRKDLGTGFATASEVARTAAGDCTEHSVLLAALLRAAGIPARTVAGLVYLEEFAGVRGVFGYHMWVQAHVGGRWLDLDATLPGGFGPTHIALATSELSGPDGVADLERVVPLMGRLRVRVVETWP